MKTVKQIPHPKFDSARRLKPLEMNNLRCRRQHTVLTPEQLDRIAARSEAAMNGDENSKL